MENAQNKKLYVNKRRNQPQEQEQRRSLLQPTSRPQKYDKDREDSENEEREQPKLKNTRSSSKQPKKTLKKNRKVEQSESEEEESRGKPKTRSKKDKRTIAKNLVIKRTHKELQAESNSQEGLIKSSLKRTQYVRTPEQKKRWKSFLKEKLPQFQKEEQRIQRVEDARKIFHQTEEYQELFLDFYNRYMEKKQKQCLPTSLTHWKDQSRLEQRYNDDKKSNL